VGKVQGGKEERLESVLLQMSEAQNWAQAQMGAAILRGAPRRQPPTEDEAPLLVQIVTGNVFLCGSPVEHFSQKMPVLKPDSAEDERLRPIDILYGRYTPVDRTIEILVNRIEKDAPEFGCEPGELIKLIRIHEYAHAVVHLGIRVEETAKLLRNWADLFLEERTRWYLNYDHKTPLDLGATRFF